MTAPTATCKHCDVKIVLNGATWVHSEGDHIGKHTCAIDPYGYGAAPIGAPCTPICNGHPRNS